MSSTDLAHENTDLDLQGSLITVEASDSLFEEVGKNSYTFEDLLSELIDNSIAGRYDDRAVQIDITVAISMDNPERNYIRVKDDGKGIPIEILGKALSLAAIRTSGSLNEHGMGMKQAVAGLGQLEQLTTKTLGSGYADSIDRFRFGTFHTKLKKVDWESGTEIIIKNLKAIVPTDERTSYDRRIPSLLGARYRRFLGPVNRRAVISLERVDLDDNSRPLVARTLNAVEPIYFDRLTRKNKPLYRESFKGKYQTCEGRYQTWEVELVFGFAPSSDQQWKLLNLQRPYNWEAYYTSQRKQGLDLILNDRVIVFHQFTELFEKAGEKHGRWNFVRGEIIFKDGFVTAITKNQFVANHSYKEALKKIEKFLFKEGMIDITIPSAGSPDELTLSERLARHLAKSERNSEIYREYTLEGVGGRFDIFDYKKQEAWEVKVGPSRFLDVYQLFAYLDIKGLSKGYLVASSHAGPSKLAVKHIKRKHGVDIRLRITGRFPINQPLTRKERNDRSLYRKKNRLMQPES